MEAIDQAQFNFSPTVGLAVSVMVGFLDQGGKTKDRKGMSCAAHVLIGAYGNADLRGIGGR